MGIKSIQAQAIDRQKLLAVLIKEGRKAFSSFKKKYDTEQFYAFSLYTDNNINSIFPCANTLEGLDRMTYDNRDWIHGESREDQEAGVQEVKWNPEEWDLEIGSKTSFFRETNRLLASMDVSSASIEESDRRRKVIVDILTEGLYQIKLGGVFGDPRPDKLFFFINIGDAEDHEIPILLDAAKRYNQAEMYTEYEAEVTGNIYRELLRVSTYAGEIEVEYEIIGGENEAQELGLALAKSVKHIASDISEYNNTELSKIMALVKKGWDEEMRSTDG